MSKVNNFNSTHTQNTSRLILFILLLIPFTLHFTKLTTHYHDDYLKYKMSLYGKPVQNECGILINLHKLDYSNKLSLLPLFVVERHNTGCLFLCVSVIKSENPCCLLKAIRI